jgi:hypothetical protein
MANGDKDNPLRKHASAAAVAIGPGIPFTMTYIFSLSLLPSLAAAAALVVHGLFRRRDEVVDGIINAFAKKETLPQMTDKTIDDDRSILLLVTLNLFMVWILSCCFVAVELKLLVVVPLKIHRER